MTWFSIRSRSGRRWGGWPLMLVGAVLVVLTTGPAAAAGGPAQNAAPAAHGYASFRQITLKLDDDTASTPGPFSHLQGPASLAALNAVLTRAGAHRSAWLFTGPDSAALRAAHNATRRSARPIADFSQYFRIQVPAGIDPAVLSAQLAKLPGVQDAYPAPLPAPAPGFAPAPPVPSFTALQHYADAAPSGVGAQQTVNWPGATGTQVKIVDVEYSWNTAHNDLPKARAPGARLASGTPVDPYTDNNHGTAVLGVLAAAPNSYGVSGLAAGATLGLVNVDSVEKGYDPAGAILLAASKMRAGDVLLLEQQAYGPSNRGYVPLEWIPEVFDAIRYTVHAGINVVEAAGNGGQNLNDPSFGSPFPRGKADSGAIIVGAGASPGFAAAAGSSPCVLSNPARSRESSSNFGSRLDLQGWGECVTTTGYGDLYGGNQYPATGSYYTEFFDGTSAASAIVAATVADFASAYQRLNGRVAPPGLVRAVLRSTGTPQTGATAERIGPLPNLSRALLQTDLTNPTAPGTLRALAGSGPTAHLQWTAASDNVGVAHYQVLRNDVLLTVTTAAVLSFTDTHVARHRTYRYKIQAVDRSERRSPFTAISSVTIP